MNKHYGLGFQLTGAILLFGYLGYVADGWLGSSPWLLIVGAFVGFAAGFYAIYRAVTGAHGNDPPNPDPPAPPAAR
jgi:ATP synthase protein I